MSEKRERENNLVIFEKTDIKCHLGYSDSKCIKLLLNMISYLFITLGPSFKSVHSYTKNIIRTICLTKRLSSCPQRNALSLLISFGENAFHYMTGWSDTINVFISPGCLSDSGCVCVCVVTDRRVVPVVPLRALLPDQFSITAPPDEQAKIINMQRQTQSGCKWQEQCSTIKTWKPPLPAPGCLHLQWQPLNHK